MASYHNLDITDHKQTKQLIKNWTGSRDHDILAVRRTSVTLSGASYAVIEFANSTRAFFNWQGDGQQYEPNSAPKPDAIVDISDADATCTMIVNWLGSTIIAAMNKSAVLYFANDDAAFPGFPNDLPVLRVGIDIIPAEQTILDRVGADLFGMHQLSPATSAFLTKLLTERDATENFIENPQNFVTNFATNTHLQFDPAEVTTLVNTATAQPDRLRTAFNAGRH